MSQEPTDDLVVYLGLQDFTVDSVEVRAAPRLGDAGRRIKIVHVSNRSGRHQCRDCGRHVERGLFEEYEPIRFRDASIGDFETYLQIHAMRIACCGGTRVERLPFAMPRFRMTRRFFERIAALCTKLPVWSVAKMGRLSWDTVARVDKRAIELALGDREHALEGLRWIGVDEVSRTGGRVYFTVVTNLKTGRVVWIGDGKGEKGLLPFLELIGGRGRKRIRGAVSDLGYQAVLTRHLPHAAHVLDRFHIVQWVNEALNQLRRRLFSGAPQDDLGRTFKIKKWMLLSAREKLPHKDKLVLAKLMALNRPLFQAYLLKEQLRAILQYPWKYLGALRSRIREWIDAVLATDLAELARVARRLEPHIEAVVAGHRHDIKLGLVESINSKIAALRVQARGYSDPEYFKLKIFQRCALPDNPWAHIVL
jgi:transposase